MTVYRKVGGAKSYKKWTEWQPGDYVEGIYTGQSIDQFDKPNYHLDVLGHKFADGTVIPEGRQFALNSNGSLDYKMQSVEEGDKIMVEYIGKEVMKDGKYKGKPFHNIEVSIADKFSSVEDDDL